MNVNRRKSFSFFLKLCFFSFLYCATFYVLDKYPETAPPGEFFEWLMDMLELAFANISVVAAPVSLLLLVHKGFERFCSLCSSCRSRFATRSSTADPESVTTAVPSLAQLETSDQPSTDIDNVSRSPPETPSLLWYLIAVIVFGANAINHFFRTDLQLPKHSPSVSEGVVVFVLKYSIRSIAATLVMLLLFMCIGSAYVNLRMRRREGGEATALATALDETERAQAVPQTANESSEKGELAVSGETIIELVEV